MKQTKSIGELFFRYTRNELTAAEKKALDAWRAQSAVNEEVFQTETNPEHTREVIRQIYQNRERIYEEIKTRYPKPWEPAVPRIYTRSQKAWRIAATILVLLSTGLYLSIQGDRGIHAGSYQATLVSPDKISTGISDFSRGYITRSQGILVEKNEKGELVYYPPNNERKGKDKLFRLYTARGGMISIQFPDSTKVWLNAESQIHFPANFSQDTIRVRIEGEAYLEMTSGQKRHYIIDVQQPANGQQPSVNDFEIEPSEAHLNISSYANDQVLRATLLKGSAMVRINRSSSPVPLGPGQMAEISHQKITVDSLSAKKETIEWKNGETYYHDADIQTILRDVSRWYNVEVLYLGKITDKKFTIRLPRDAEFSDLTEELKKQGARFILSRKILTVFPDKKEGYTSLPKSSNLFGSIHIFPIFFYKFIYWNPGRIVFM